MDAEKECSCELGFDVDCVVLLKNNNSWVKIILENMYLLVNGIVLGDDEFHL